MAQVVKHLLHIMGPEFNPYHPYEMALTYNPSNGRKNKQQQPDSSLRQDFPCPINLNTSAAGGL